MRSPETGVWNDEADKANYAPKHIESILADDHAEEDEYFEDKEVFEEEEEYWSRERLES